MFFLWLRQWCFVFCVLCTEQSLWFQSSSWPSLLLFCSLQSSAQANCYKSLQCCQIMEEVLQRSAFLWTLEAVCLSPNAFPPPPPPPRPPPPPPPPASPSPPAFPPAVTPMVVQCQHQLISPAAADFFLCFVMLCWVVVKQQNQLTIASADPSPASRKIQDASVLSVITLGGVK